MNYLQLALEEAKKCPENMTAYSVGCVVVKDGKIISSGYSRKDGSRGHAEEIALRDISEGGMLFSTMEPCSVRNSSSVSCTEHIINKKIKKVVFGCKEPGHFQKCEGVKKLEENGVEVVHMKEMEQECLDIAQQHLIQQVI